MKRDDDLLRELLFRLEADEGFLSVMPGGELAASEEERRERGHILLLSDAGYVSLTGPHNAMVRLTNSGHDFIQTVRSDTAWSRIKKAGSDAGGITLSLMFDLGKAFLRQEIMERTGLEI